ncbi:polymorphic toxin-type HINT domain-containing protein, partial [Streptomyces sp. TRM68367]|uniref:polymorphic toxin-type HINT domain-containing protein n=1 Tax=Streptomyces sp. TRM68367 TaxID=2758415 RepID=UPI00165C6387
RTKDGHTATLHTTANHPFWDDTTHTWVPAGKLHRGDALNTTGDDRLVHVIAVRVTPGAANRWNLTVQQLHTYYVLAGGTAVLVHNACPNTNGLQPGDNPAAQVGKEVHHDPATEAAFDAMGYKRGPGQGADQPDFLTPNGDPVELKPFTKRGAREGTRQLRRYLNNSGSTYGELWGYSFEDDLLVLRKMAVPRVGSLRRWTWLIRP